MHLAQSKRLRMNMPEFRNIPVFADNSMRIWDSEVSSALCLTLWRLRPGIFFRYVLIFCEQFANFKFFAYTS